MKPLPFLFGSGAVQAVVPHADEAFGQDMLAPAAQALVRAQGDDAPPAGGAVLAVEADVAAGVVAFEPWLAQCALVDVAGKVAQGGDTASDGLRPAH